MIDTHERLLIENFWNPQGCSKMDRLFDFMLRLIRRDEASDRTLRNVQRLGEKKQAHLSLMAFRYLTPGDWYKFREKMKLIGPKGTGVQKITIKLPWGSMRSVQRGAQMLLRNVL